MKKYARIGKNVLKWYNLNELNNFNKLSAFYAKLDLKEGKTSQAFEIIYKSSLVFFLLLLNQSLM